MTMRLSSGRNVCETTCLVYWSPATMSAATMMKTIDSLLALYFLTSYAATRLSML
jgi:hypothetical protein